MKLTLSVLSFKNQFIAGIDDITIDHDGCTIGRSTDNTLALPDTEKVVSRHHAYINFDNGCYFLVDTSLSGIHINNGESLLHNASQRISNGMVFKIGEYEISATLTESNEQAIDDSFPFPNEAFLNPPALAAESFLTSAEPLFESEEIAFNPLMSDAFAKHEELLPASGNEARGTFESNLHVNHRSPLLDSYIAPRIQPTPTKVTVAEEIPEHLSIDDFFSSVETPTPSPVITKATVDDDFAALFDEHLSEIVESEQSASLLDNATNDNSRSSQLNAPFSGTAEAAVKVKSNSDIFVAVSESTPTVNVDQVAPLTAKTQPRPENSPSVLDHNVLFDAFLHGVRVRCERMPAKQQAETLLRIGQMFRTFVDGTVAILRSRAEFKSLFRISMTVIKPANNNPLKFTVATDDLLRQLIENDTNGFLLSTDAIEEAFHDIKNHQLAIQAGIQASLMDFLKKFDPKGIEKQFEQGIVLQKKAKCWDKYEEIYRDTVEDAMENFFGDEFVKAYEKQMDLLNNPIKK